MTDQELPEGERPNLASIDDLLTDDEKAELHRDLQEIARCRRRAEAEGRNIVLG